MKCYEEAETRLFGEDIIEGLKDPIAKSFRKECNCLPSCTAITYEGDIERTAIDDSNPNAGKQQVHFYFHKNCNKFQFCLGG